MLSQLTWRVSLLCERYCSTHTGKVIGHARKTTVLCTPERHPYNLDICLKTRTWTDFNASHRSFRLEVEKVQLQLAGMDSGPLVAESLPQGLAEGSVEVVLVEQG